MSHWELVIGAGAIVAVLIVWCFMAGAARQGEAFEETVQEESLRRWQEAQQLAAEQDAADAQKKEDAGYRWQN